jgi:hypothetical protein
VSASKAPHRSRTWWSSAFTRSKAPYLSRARRSSSCHPQLETRKRHDTATAPYLEDVPCGATVDPQRLVQRAVERGAVAAKLPPQLLLLLGVGERRQVVGNSLHLGGVAGARRRGLGAMSRPPATT